MIRILTVAQDVIGFFQSPKAQMEYCSLKQLFKTAFAHNLGNLQRQFQVQCFVVVDSQESKGISKGHQRFLLPKRL